MIYEMKKFYKNSAVLILFVLAIFLSVALTAFFIHDYQNYDYSSGTEVTVSGIKGLQLRKSQMEKTAGPLTTEKLNQALSLYKSRPAGDQAYYQTEDAYPQLFQFLHGAYAPYGEEDSFLVSSISNADDFYEKQIEKLKAKAQAQGLSLKETKEAVSRAVSLKKPFYLDFVDQWPVLIKALIFVYGVIAVSAIFISNQLFSFEKEKNMDLILNSLSRKKRIAIANNKLLAMLTYLTFEFLLCSLFVSSVVFLLVGVQGWNAPIQIMPEFSTAIYHWTFGQLFLTVVGTGWLCIMATALVGALINVLSQKTYVSLLLTLLLVLPPLFLKNSELLPVGLKKLLCIQPINGVNLLSAVDSLFSYSLGPWTFLNTGSLCLLAAAVAAISFGLIPILAAKTRR